MIRDLPVKYVHVTWLACCEVLLIENPIPWMAEHACYLRNETTERAQFLEQPVVDDGCRGNRLASLASAGQRGVGVLPFFASYPRRQLVTSSSMILWTTASEVPAQNNAPSSVYDRGDKYRLFAANLLVDVTCSRGFLDVKTITHGDYDMDG